MKHYKTPEGQLFAFESDGSQDHLIAENMAAVSADELKALLESAKPSRAQVIRARLAQIDQDSIRPARAVAAALASGQAAPVFDARKLAELELEAQALRQELAAK